MYSEQVYLNWIFRIVLATLCGCAIGYERISRNKSAGIRTHAIIALGSSMFMIISKYAFFDVSTADGARVAAQIVSGIGFIGGGLILKDGFNVRGLNTAATIWCSAACGTLSGVGLYAEAAVLVACVLITHCLFRPLCTWIEKKESGLFQYTVHVECEQNLSNKIQQIIMKVLSFDRNVKLNALFHKTSGKKAIVYCDMEMQGEHKVLLDLLVSRLRSQDGVFSAGWEKKNLPQEDF